MTYRPQQKSQFLLAINTNQWLWRTQTALTNQIRDSSWRQNTKLQCVNETNRTFAISSYIHTSFDLINLLIGQVYRFLNYISSSAFYLFTSSQLYFIIRRVTLSSERKLTVLYLYLHFLWILKLLEDENKILFLNWIVENYWNVIKYERGVLAIVIKHF